MYIIICYARTEYCNLRISHVCPVYPGGQVHVFGAVQILPFGQGGMQEAGKGNKEI